MKTPGKAAEDVAFNYEDEETIEGRGTGGLGPRDLALTRLERLLRALARLPDGSTVLEVGCGAGRQARTVKAYQTGLKLFGCDFSRRAIAEARDHQDGVDYLIADAGCLPYGSARFDAVILFDLLEHVPDVQAVVREVARVTKPGGLFHGFIPVEGQPRTLFYHLRDSRTLPITRWKRERIGHIQQLTDAGVRELFAKNGFELFDFSYSFHLFGQILDITDYWSRDIRARPNCPAWQQTLTSLLARSIIWPCWRLAYWEDRFRAGSNRATGLHLTARRTHASISP